MFSNFNFNIGDDNKMALFSLFRRFQYKFSRNFSLFKFLQANSRFTFYITILLFPNAVAFVFCLNDQKVHRGIVSATHFFILLHERDKNISLVPHWYPELRIIEPPIVRIELYKFRLSINDHRGRAAHALPLPFAINRIYRPLFWKDPTHIQLIEIL